MAHQRSVLRAMSEHHSLQLAGVLRPELCGAAVPGAASHGNRKQREALQLLASAPRHAIPGE
eukprot:7442879-Pyramimonas_sp.AAC.1